MNGARPIRETGPNQEAPLTVREALKHGISRLRRARVPSDTLATELLLICALERDRTWLYAHPEALLTPEQTEAFQGLIDRRASGVPTQYLTGKQEFWGLEFEVNPDVLIPRPETEHVIEVALDRLALGELRAGRPNKNTGKGLRIADVGAGSGCIAIALAKELPEAEFFALDSSPAALAVASRNAKRHGVSSRFHFLESNLFEALPPACRLELIVSNPPYVGRREALTLAREVRDHEPELALYGGEEGYEFYANLISESLPHLGPGGLLILELGHNSLPAVEPLVDSPLWTNLSVTNDLAGVARVLAAERTAERL